MLRLNRRARGTVNTYSLCIYNFYDKIELFDIFVDLIFIIVVYCIYVFATNIQTQWLQNFSCERTSYNMLVLRSEQNIDLFRNWWTAWINLADLKKTTLGITALACLFTIKEKKCYFRDNQVSLYFVNTVKLG
jgi:hypothetical protein